MKKSGSFNTGAPERMFSPQNPPKEGEKAISLKQMLANESMKAEQGDRIEITGKDGESHQAAVLDKETVAYKVENEGIPELVVESVEAEATPEVSGVETLNATLETMEEESESAFEKAVKSKWSLAGAGGRLLSAIKGSEAVSFAYDLKDMFVGKKAEVVDLGDGETEQVIGTKGLVGTGLEAMWGAPKDVIKALGAAAAEVGNAAESEAGRMELAETAKFAQDFADFENVADKRGFLARSKEALSSAIKSPFEIVKNVGRHVQGEMIYPVIKGNMDMLKFVQEKITGSGAETAVDLDPEYESLSDLEASLEDNWDNLQAELADEEEKLDTVVTDRRIEKLKAALAKSVGAKAKLAVQPSGMTLTQRRDSLRELTATIEAQKAEISSELADRATLLEAVKNIQALEEAKSELDQLAA